MNSPGGTDFAFWNDHAGVSAGPCNAGQWISPAPTPGEVVLLSNCPMHAVPTDPGARRITLAVNAIPTHLDPRGCEISCSG